MVGIINSRNIHGNVLSVAASLVPLHQLLVSLHQLSQINYRISNYLFWYDLYVSRLDIKVHGINF